MKKLLTFAAVALFSINSAYAGLIYSTSNTSSNLRDISTTGTQFNLSDDDTTGNVEIGFDFGFFDIMATTVDISSNGFMAVGNELDDDGCCDGLELGQNDSYNGIVAALWEDLYSNNNTTGTMFYQTLGNIGSREFVVGFYDVAHYPSSDLVTFEMILHEGSNNIELQYGNIETHSGTHTIGIESPDASEFSVYSYNQDIAALSNTGVLFSTGPVTPVSEPSMLAIFAFGLLAIRRLRKNV